MHSVEDEVKISLAPATIEANPLASALTDLGLEFSDYGVSSESAIFYSVVPPIMEYTLWGLIKSSARLEITMPDSIRINHFESEKGLGSVGVIDGKQILSYRTPVCPEAENWPQCYREHDTISWSVEVSYMFILGEVVQYILVCLLYTSDAADE